jgi:hypothetical protein
VIDRDVPAESDREVSRFKHGVVVNLTGAPSRRGLGERWS